MPCSAWWERFAQEGLALHSTVEQCGADFIVVQTNKLALRIGVPEFPFKNFRVPLANAKSDERSHVAENGTLNLRTDLIDVLVGQG